MRARLQRGLAPAPAFAFIAVMFVGALAGAAATSVTPLGGAANLDAWNALLRDPAFGDAVLFTAQTAVISTTVAALIGVSLALLLHGRSTLLRGLVAIPVPVPHLLVATVAVLWLGPGGLAERLLGAMPFALTRDPAGLGIIAVYVYKEAPFLMLLTLTALDRGHSERLEAAAAHGATRRQRLAWVTWPTIRSPLLLGCIVVFAYALGAFEVPLVIGPSYPQTIAEYARSATEGDLITGQSTASAALLISATISIALSLLALRFVRGTHRA